MTRDKKDISPDHFAGDDQDGTKREQAVTSTETSGEEIQENDETVITVSIVDEIIKLDQDEAPVLESKSPKAELQQVDRDQSIISLNNVPQLKKINQRTETIVCPQQRLPGGNEAVTAGSVNINVPSVNGVTVEQIPLSKVVRVQPDGMLETEEKHEISIINQFELDNKKEAVTNMVEPSQTTEQRQDIDGQFLEINEMDPIFTWGGGSPYGSNKPRFVIHIDKDINNEEFPSLELLQAVLRDTYTEIEGGQPGAETVEFIANEPRIPSVQHNIVTLDLTEGEWEPKLRNGEPVIEGQSIDLVSKLQDVVSELYTGQLGYFVLNIPEEWNHPVRRKGFHRKLVKTLAGQNISNDLDEDRSIIEAVQASPVVLAEPTITDVDMFFELAWQYFSLSPRQDASSIGQIEEVKERVLKQNDWRRVALTERQQKGDGESDEHYFWKAAIVIGLARSMWEENNAGFTDFDDFISQNLLTSDTITTENDKLDGIDGVPDIYIEPQTSWMGEGLTAFLPTEDRVKQSSVAIEFETGRSEGAFNFRKISETLEKFEDRQQHELIYLVIPTRVLFRGKKRAEMIDELVDSWSDRHGNAELCIPVVSRGICTRLQSAEDVIQDLYGGDNDS